MKIKGFFIIPLVAILVAMFTLGVVPGAASDTTAEKETSDTLTVVPTTKPATSSMDEEIGGFVSDFIGDDLQNMEGPIRGFSERMADFLNTVREYLLKIISLFEMGGGFLGDGSLGDLAGGLLG